MRSGDLAKSMEEDQWNVIVAGLNPCAIRTERYNVLINDDQLITWTWFNLARRNIKRGSQPIMYVALGKISERKIKTRSKLFSLLCCI